MTEAVIFMANGTEECEALLVVDILRRADITIDMVSIEEGLEVKTAHDVRIICDLHIDDFDLNDTKILIIPGGLGGTNRMLASDKLSNLLVEQRKNQGLLAAVCAGPSVLGKLNLLEERNATVYPGFEDKLGDGATFQDKPVIFDQDTITARGLGASIPFALKIVEALRDEATAKDVAEKIVYYA